MAALTELAVLARGDQEHGLRERLEVVLLAGARVQHVAGPQLYIAEADVSGQHGHQFPHRVRMRRQPDARRDAIGGSVDSWIAADRAAG